MYIVSKLHISLINSSKKGILNRSMLPIILFASSTFGPQKFPYSKTYIFHVHTHTYNNNNPRELGTFLN